MENLLENWRQKVLLNASSINIYRPFVCNATDVEKAYQILQDFFTLEYFNHTSDANWINSMLSAPFSMSAVSSIYELASNLEYIKSNGGTLLKKFLSLRNDPRQFRDMLFEVYLFRVFERAKVPINKKPKIGKELDFTCLIHGQEYLCEAKREYAPLNNTLLLKIRLFELLVSKLNQLKKAIPFSLRLAVKQSAAIGEIVTKKLDVFIANFNTQNFSTIDYSDLSEDVQLDIYSLSHSRIDSNKCLPWDCELAVKLRWQYIPQKRIYEGLVEVDIEHTIEQCRIDGKLMSSLNRKQAQHAGADIPNKIYFFESEMAMDFNLPVFVSENSIGKTLLDQIIASLEPNEIVCLILKDVTGPIPRRSIKILGKNIPYDVGFVLRKLPLHLDYKIHHY